MSTYDADARAALTVALRRVLDLPGASWAEVLAAAPFDDQRRSALASGNQPALDALARELNELRTL